MLPDSEQAKMILLRKQSHQGCFPPFLPFAGNLFTIPGKWVSLPSMPFILMCFAAQVGWQSQYHASCMLLFILGFRFFSWHGDVANLEEQSSLWKGLLPLALDGSDFFHLLFLSFNDE